MGERGNIVVVGGWDPVDRKPPIWLYTHWGGHELAETLARALGRHERWTDTAYLTRIIFCELVGIEQWSDETGFGISTEPCDNGYPVLIVDVPGQRVIVHTGDVSSEAVAGAAEQEEHRDWVVAFADYRNLPELFQKAMEG